MERELHLSNSYTIYMGVCAVCLHEGQKKPKPVLCGPGQSPSLCREHLNVLFDCFAQGYEILWQDIIKWGNLAIIEDCKLAKEADGKG